MIPYIEKFVGLLRSEFYQSLNAQEQREVNEWFQMREVKDYFFDITINDNPGPDINTELNLDELLLCRSGPIFSKKKYGKKFKKP